MAEITFANRAHLLRLVIEAISESISTRTAYLIARWWGCEVAEECRFRGLPVFRRPAGARIVVGPRCTFLSGKKANLHGINRPCMLSCLNYKAKIQIGANSGFSGTVIAAAQEIVVGERVLCGANTTISDTDSHALDFRERHPEHYGVIRSRSRGAVKTEPVVIEDDVWLGMDV